VPSGRVCNACGRRLNTDEHDLDGHRVIEDRRHGTRKVRQWVCRVRLLADRNATDLATGKSVSVSHYVPQSAQREGDTNVRYVPMDVVRAWARD
jgi:hypothetical protein